MKLARGPAQPASKKKLLIVRHADAGDQSDFALTGKPDSLRPLSEKGRAQMRAAALTLKQFEPKLELVATSPYTRAAQTAAIITGVYKIAAPVEMETLEPGNRPDRLVEWLASQNRADVVAVVGHEPDLGVLAAWLITGDVRTGIRMRKGGACLVSFAGAPSRGDGVLEWLLTGNQLARASR